MNVFVLVYISMTANDPHWKRLKLSLERPYKDDNGDPIPDLFDITPEGQHIYQRFVVYLSLS